eukprot:g3806.t1
MDEMEEIWRDVAPETDSSPQQPESVLDTGREAYLRTKQALDEASAVSNILLLDDGRNMSKRYQQPAQGLDDSFDAAVDAGAGGWTADTDKGSRDSALFGESSLFLPTGEADSSVGGSGRVSKDMGGGILAAAAGGRASLGVVDIRPEEKQFCGAFLDLQNVMKRLPPGARVRPTQIWAVLQKMINVSSSAETAASDSAARLRELRGSGSSAVAIAAATAHELSLEKDTWSLLMYLNGADEEDENMKDDMRREEEKANGSGDDVGCTRFAPPGPNASDQELLRRMHDRDSEFRRTEAVVDWLQGAMNARSGTVDLGGMGMGTRGGHFAWSSTLESLAVAGGQKSEVGQMHPDANLRKVGHGRGDGRGHGEGHAGLKVMRLVGQDDLDEEELLRTAWLLVRSGKLGDAMRLCEGRGQPWRAAAMGGGGVVGTGVLKSDSGEKEGFEGDYRAAFSPGQGLWQEMCWQLSVSLEKGADSSEGPARSVAKHEAALFAHLAGNTRLLLDSDLTQSWEDQAWVRFTALMHLKVLDERIRHRQEQAALSSRYPGVESLEVDIRLLDKMRQRAPPTSHGAIFEVLDDNSRGRVRAEGKGVYRQAQQALVLGGKDIPLFLRNILWRVAAVNSSTDEDGTGHGHGSDASARPSSSSPSPEVFRSPQLLRFAAHLALVLAAQCPYLTTMEEETVEAIEDVVYAYTQHLAKTHQVGLVAIYAATLPKRRRRELYAAFLRGVEGDANRREALAQANSQMPGDVPAILKKVVEDVRLQTVSVAPPEPRQVPEGDMKKINAMSWLLDHPDTQAEAAVQANALARHLVLQKYHQSVIGGPSAVGRAGRSWAGPLGDGDGDGAISDDLETPVVLSARVEAVKILLEMSWRGEDDVVMVGDDDDRERECWMLLLEAREAYVEWVTACRAREGGGAVEGEGGEDDEEAVRAAAERAVEALEGVLTFEDGWMYPTPRCEDAAASIASVTQRGRATPNSETSSLGSWEHVNVERDVERDAAGNPVDGGTGSDISGETGGGGAVDGAPPDSMVVSFPNEEEKGGESGWGPGDEVRVTEEKRKAKEVIEARQTREREEEESVKGMEEAARRAGEVAREEEMLRVRGACLPGVVFLTHEVAHDTGLWMLRWRSTDAAKAWFTRAQTLANTIVKDEFRTLPALSPGHMEQFLHCVERSTTKLLECAEPRA